MLAINVYDNDTGKRVDYADASVMIERGGAKIGIIGAIGDCYSSIAPDKVEGIHFKVGSDLTALVKAEATRLRQQGADIIVYSLHDGYGSSGNGSITNGKLASFYDASLSDGYVDLVFEGHTHQRYVLQDSHGVYHLQNGGENKGISHAKVAVNVANDSTDVQAAEFIASGAYTHMADDPVVDRLLDQYADDIEDANRMLGYNSRYRSSRALMQLVADRYYEAGMERWGDKYKISPSAVPTTLTPARSPTACYRCCSPLITTWCCARCKGGISPLNSSLPTTTATPFRTAITVPRSKIALIRTPPTTLW